MILSPPNGTRVPSSSYEGPPEPMHSNFNKSILHVQMPVHRYLSMPRCQVLVAVSEMGEWNDSVLSKTL